MSQGWPSGAEPLSPLQPSEQEAGLRPRVGGKWRRFQGAVQPDEWTVGHGHAVDLCRFQHMSSLTLT